MRLIVLALVIAGCGRVGFDASTDARTDATSPRLVWLPFDDDPTDGADNRGSASTTAACEASCPTLVAGRHDGAYAFDGSQALRLERATELELTEGTVAAWIRSSAPLAADEHRHVGGTAFGDTGTNTWEMFLYRTSTGAGPFFQVGGDANSALGDGPYTWTSWTVPDNTWVHVALTWRAQGMQRLVVDGVTVMTNATFKLEYDAHDILVGADEDTATSGFWRGAIDDFIIIGRALDDTEIQALAGL